MALSGNGVFEVRAGGNDGNAGYFNPLGGSPGVDYSLQNTAQVTIDGSTVSAAVHTTTTQINITGASVSGDWNRNGLRITGGSATAGLYEITAVDGVNNRLTVDRAAGTSGQTVLGTMGGAFASPAMATLYAVNGCNIFLKYDANPYLITTATVNVPGGALQAAAEVGLINYDTNRDVVNTDVNRSTLRIASGVSNATICFDNSQTIHPWRVIFDGNGQTGSSGFRCRGTVHSCLFKNFIGIACQPSNAAMMYNCEATGNAGISFGGPAYYCRAWGNTSSPFVSTWIPIQNCIAASNTGATTDGFVGNNCVGCISYKNGRHGFTSGGRIYSDNIAEGNGGVGFAVTVGAVNHRMALYNRNFAYGNSGGAVTSGVPPASCINTAATQSCFVDGDNGDFRINDLAGGGALLRAVNFPMPSLPLSLMWPFLNRVDPSVASAGGFIIGG